MEIAQSFQSKRTITVGNILKRCALPVLSLSKGALCAVRDS
jgi:hypothetical protein